MRSNVAAGFREHIASLKRKHADRVAEMRAALSQSPAVFLSRDDFTELVIVTGDTHPSAGDRKLRATTFLHDGPWGHENYKDMEDVASELARRSWNTVIPASDDEVQEWTSTPEFIAGSKRVAFAQAANALRYMASRDGYNSETYRRAQRILSDAEMMDDIDAATAKLEHELRAFDPDRRAHSFVENPPWVTKALADAYESVSSKVPPAWLPRLTHVKSSHGGVTAKVKEYGCGKYGCVLPTLDPKIVLKVTSDDTEAQFAEHYSPTLVDPVVVDYFAVVPLPDRHKGRPVYLLWRESAKHVGAVDAVVGSHAGNLIDIQHAAAADVLYLVMDKADRRHIDAAAEVWLDTLEQIADEVPELESLAKGMMAIYRQQGVFIGDVHTGNLGVVTRDGKDQWVITDPGNVIVFRK